MRDELRRGVGRQCFFSWQLRGSGWRCALRSAIMCCWFVVYCRADDVRVYDNSCRHWRVVNHTIATEDTMRAHQLSCVATFTRPVVTNVSKL
jgi:hypothetical protein